MQHTTNTRVIFSDSMEDAKEQYLKLGLATEDPEAILEGYKVSEVEDFDFNEDFNFIGEISVSPEVMKTINTDPMRAYVFYYIEETDNIK